MMAFSSRIGPLCFASACSRRQLIQTCSTVGARHSSDACHHAWLGLCLIAQLLCYSLGQTINLFTEIESDLCGRELRAVAHDKVIQESSLHNEGIMTCPSSILCKPIPGGTSVLYSHQRGSLVLSLRGK